MIALLPSVTIAVRIKKSLRKNGIDSYIVQTPKGLKDGGCSFSLKFDKKHLSEVMAAVERAGTQIMALHDETKGGMG